MSTIKSSAEDLTLNADGSGNDIIFQSNGSNVATLDQAGLLTATTFAGSGASLTALPAANITGTLPAISGANLTGISSQGRNLIINGGFDVWQRGTSATHAGSYLADRWKNYHSVAEAVSRQTFTPGQTDVDGFPTYYARHGGGSAAWYVVDQRIENVNLTAGKEVTLSYWMKGSSAFTNAGAYTQNFGSGGSGEVFLANLTHSITTSWAKHTTTWTMPSITGKTIGANNYLMISVLRANLTDIVVDIANVQLEIGGSATDFEQRTYGEELALCQRYCQLISHSDAALPGSTSGSAELNNLGHPLTTVLRTTPTITQAATCGFTSWYGDNNGVADATANFSGITYNNGGNILRFNITDFSGVSDNRLVGGYHNTGSSSAYHIIAAEL
jgi:hypothetical protein